MMTDFPKLTYAVSLGFDALSSEKLISVQKSFSEITGNFYLMENSVPPHLTLGMFHADESEFDEIKNAFSDFASQAGSNFSVGVSGLDGFSNRVVFLRLTDVDHRLNHLNEKLHRDFLVHFESGGNFRYLPENWFPHVSVAVKLNRRQYEIASSASIDIPDFLNADSLTLFQCRPYIKLIESKLT